jgi:alkanesulfonate monooxygenase SsuD/methylene tetrahydromethanopterin reductase-like flavin-dependent oxidoreductase (luciferase family)
MARYGYFLSSEEYDPASLIRQAKMAEQAGFEALWISDHFHPWLDEQGNSSFVWSVIGAISQVIRTIRRGCADHRVAASSTASQARAAGARSSQIWLKWCRNLCGHASTPHWRPRRLTTW